MKYLFFIAILAIASCSNQHQYAKAENAFDAGREFIDALLKGDFDKASFYMAADEQNKKLLEQYERKYNAQSSEIKKQYYQSVINILSVDDITEQETIINYSNSYDKKAHKVKVKFINGSWFIDFKFTFDGNL
jgi:hypothetical protein